MIHWNANPIMISAGDSGNQVANVTYYLNGVQIGESASAPSFPISVIPQSHGPAQLRAVANLVDGSVEETTISFTIQ